MFGVVACPVLGHEEAVEIDVAGVLHVLCHVSSSCAFGYCEFLGF